MRRYPDAKSPWRKRLWFEPHEFDTLMDGWRAGAGGDACYAAGRGVDVDRVLLAAVPGQAVEADYADLPAGVLGRTCFAPDGTVRVELDRALADAARVDPIARRRMRATRAHECGHIAGHRELCPRHGGAPSLFGDDVTESKPPMLCRHDVVGDLRYAGEWWEVQANLCMASLLLPRAHFGSSVRGALAARGYASFADALMRGEGESLVRSLSALYDVSLSVAVYRLGALGFIPADAQHGLSLTA